MNAHIAAALLAMIAGSACAGRLQSAPPSPSQAKEITMSTGPRSSRPPPATVPPVVHQGVRYEQDMQSARFGGTQSSGYLVAVDADSGARLWMLKVYEVPSQPGAPFQLQRFFRSMRLGASGATLEIESEAGGHYVVDLAARTSTWLDGPDSVHQPHIRP